MARVFNFCAGPAALPEDVLRQAQEDILDWKGNGLSVMEMSHRSDAFVSIAESAEKDVRDLLDINDDYAVLFLQGGATAQFSAIPLNILGKKKTADYVNTGVWSRKAIAEARRYANIRIAASTEPDGYKNVPVQHEWTLNPQAAYVHFTPNETIGGLEFFWTPDTGSVPLVADASSTILSRPLDISKYGLIYAGAQKNIGPAGLTLVIVRRDLLGMGREDIPTCLNYAVAAENSSMYNTPPTYAWYLAGLVFKWLKQQGGLIEMQARNMRKSSILYQTIDQSGFYHNPISAESRSWMNIPFTLADDHLDKTFLKESEAAGLLNLKGHRSVGGMRASLYNAVSEDAVEALIDFMKDFEKRRA